MRVENDTPASPAPHRPVAQPPDLGALLARLQAFAVCKAARPLPLIAFTLAVAGWSLMWARALGVVTFAPEGFFAAIFLTGLALIAFSQRRARTQSIAISRAEGETRS